jgi:hypothetical protein
MTNITKLYQQLQEGKTTREYFVREARRQFPQFISPVTSFDDAVNILKSKRLVSENLTKEVSGARFDTLGETQMTDQAIIKRAKQLGIEDSIVLDGEGGVENAEEMIALINNSEPINEAHKLDAEQILDRMSPYAVKKGMEAELKKEKTYDNTTIDKVKERVARKLKKNPNAYDDQIIANVKKVEKQDKELEATELKKELVDKKNAMRKPKGFKADKANTKASKRENRKGKPKGVKVMPDKGVTGTEKVIKEGIDIKDEDIVKKYNEMFGKNPQTKFSDVAKALNIPEERVEIALRSAVAMPNFESKKQYTKKDVIQNLKEWLQENVTREYHPGMEVQTPDGHGIVKEVKGGTLTVELDDSDLKDYQFNVINKLMDKEPESQPEIQPSSGDEMTKADRDAAWAKIGTPMGSVKGTDTGIPKSLYSAMTPEEKIAAIIEKLNKMEEGEKKEKIKEMIKSKLKEAKALVVPKTATDQQVTKIVSTDPTIKPGTPLEIIRK